MLELAGYCGKTNLEAVKHQIAQFLKRESLCLFLGAGVSSSAGFPSWLDITKHCVSKKKLITKLKKIDKISLTEKSSISDLLIALENVRGKCSNEIEFKGIVENYFLTHVTRYDYTIAQNLLFVALGALVMPSHRGAISEIVTYNFDDFLEWYMHIHGFTVQRVTELPYLENRNDIRIFHPHGYIPLAKSLCPGNPTGNGSRNIVFDLHSYERLMADKENAWNHTLAGIVRRKIPLMVGLSFDDPPLKHLISQVKQEMEKEPSWKSGDSWRPIGILLKLESEIKGKENDYILRGIAPVGFANYDEIWEFLLSVCQLSAD